MVTFDVLIPMAIATVGECEEEVEFEPGTSEEEIEELFRSWLFENSDATWYYQDGRERKT